MPFLFSDWIIFHCIHVIWSLCHWCPHIFSPLLAPFISSKCPQIGFLSLSRPRLSLGSDHCRLPQQLPDRALCFQTMPPPTLQYHHCQSDVPKRNNSIMSVLKIIEALNSGCLVGIKAVSYLTSSYLYNIILCFFPAPRALFSAHSKSSFSCIIAQLCPTLCDTMDCSQPGSSVHGILQARILESVAISSSRGFSWSKDKTWVSCIGRWILHHWATKDCFLKIKSFWFIFYLSW